MNKYTLNLNGPVGTPGVKMRIGPPYPMRVVKGDEMGRFLGITV